MGLDCISNSTACPSGYVQNGDICSRSVDTVTRSLIDRPSAGAPTCASMQELVAGLCYTLCRSGYSGLLTTCYEQVCGVRVC